LVLFIKEKFLFYIAHAQSSLGNAYGILAQVEDKKENCIKAIKHYKNALATHFKEKNPLAYAQTQTNQATVYRMLSDVEDKQ